MKDIKALNNATIATIIAIVALTIIAELSEGFKKMLANITGHHWTAKGAIAIVIFFLVYMLLKRKSADYDVEKLAKKTLLATILGSLAIFLFYVYEFFK